MNLASLLSSSLITTLVEGLKNLLLGIFIMRKGTDQEVINELKVKDENSKKSGKRSSAIKSMPDPTLDDLLRDNRNQE